MDVAWHPTISQHEDPTTPRDFVLESLRKTLEVALIMEKLAPFISPRENVVVSPWKQDARRLRRRILPNNKWRLTNTQPELPSTPHTSLPPAKPYSNSSLNFLIVKAFEMYGIVRLARAHRPTNYRLGQFQPY